MNKKYNFGVNSKDNKKSVSTEVSNNILIKKFLRKWKKSGILKELKEKSYPVTRGMKNRKKKYMGKRRVTTRK